MKIKDLISNSIYCTIGYCDENHLKTLEQYIEHNKFLLDQFIDIIIVYNGEENLIKKALKIWELNLKINVQFDYLDKNLGHTFGTIQLDDKVIECCKTESFKNYKYIWKSTSDMIFFPQFLEKEIDESDFYYVNGIGYSGMQRYNFDLNKIIEQDFFPQTNFYIIKNNIDYLNDEKEMNEVYELQKQYPNKQPWELKQGFECETMLKKCIERNKLSKFHLMDNFSYLNLLNVIQKYNIHDSSHKNIILDDPGICHLHTPGEPCYSINVLKEHI